MLTHDTLSLRVNTHVSLAVCVRDTVNIWRLKLAERARACSSEVLRVQRHACGVEEDGRRGSPLGESMV